MPEPETVDDLWTESIRDSKTLPVEVPPEPVKPEGFEAVIELRRQLG